MKKAALIICLAALMTACAPEVPIVPAPTSSGGDPLSDQTSSESGRRLTSREFKTVIQAAKENALKTNYLDADYSYTDTPEPDGEKSRVAFKKTSRLYQNNVRVDDYDGDEEAFRHFNYLRSPGQELSVAPYALYDEDVGVLKRDFIYLAMNEPGVPLYQRSVHEKDDVVNVRKQILQKKTEPQPLFDLAYETYLAPLPQVLLAEPDDAGLIVYDLAERLSDGTVRAVRSLPIDTYNSVKTVTLTLFFKDDVLSSFVYEMRSFVSATAQDDGSDPCSIESIEGHYAVKANGAFNMSTLPEPTSEAGT